MNIVKRTAIDKPSNDLDPCTGDDCRTNRIPNYQSHPDPDMRRVGVCPVWNCLFLFQRFFLLFGMYALCRREPAILAPILESRVECWDDKRSDLWIDSSGRTDSFI
ncbi:hypothetical protein MFFC18_44490 [Mariniblastus fucicola]|uniref:Uncharacterized protein n=1 Tax=Mariniblastus fucicola TaxID=980251 RepID=A0A5B9PG15_9BACT|nr:hypothetical protein MFFC18_44490 [Mariniblastus fucicola]